MGDNNTTKVEKNDVQQYMCFVNADISPMESFAIGLNEPNLGVFAQHDADIAGFLTHLFAPSTSNYNHLVLELQREFLQGGAPDVTRLLFDRVAFYPATSTGRFRIVLDIRFTFGCEDSVTHKKDQTSEWTFTVDPINKNLLFYSSPYSSSRSTADEF